MITPQRIIELNQIAKGTAINYATSTSKSNFSSKLKKAKIKLPTPNSEEDDYCLCVTAINLGIGNLTKECQNLYKQYNP